MRRYVPLSPNLSRCGKSARSSCKRHHAKALAPISHFFYNKRDTIRNLNANIRTAECCDPCKCHMCEHRSNGVKSTLKPQNGSTSFRGPRANANTRSLMLENTLPVPSNRTTYTPTPRMITPHGSDSTTQQWEEYAKGGVQDDDAWAYALRKEEESRYLERLRASTPAAGPSSASTTDKLIQISPEKVTTSRNTDLLVDLDVEPEAPRGHQHMSHSYATAASSTVGGSGSAYTNLLD
jgi:helicase required for RNAi-mediated heterochromatin assembly 1